MKFMSKSDFHTYGSKFNLELNCMSGFFQKAEIAQAALASANFQLFEKLTSVN